jgi:phospholipid-binding lipoprotein MlaA
MSAMQARVQKLIAATLLILVSVLSGCAHHNVRDPLEPLNRGIYAFNDAVDKAVMKPLALGYRAVLPQVVQTGISNFFSNLDDITVLLNNLLQLKIPQAVSDTGRFVINSTIGLLGFIDVATHLGLEKHNEDFGQTLGYWGMGSGPYLMLPFLGPSSFRDGIGRWVDMRTDPVRWEDHIRTRNQLFVTRATSARARLLDSERVLDAAAIDRYAFIRDAYLQRRRSLVFDGAPPPEPDEEYFNSDPRSEAEVAPGATLVDQFGGIVAGPPPAGPSNESMPAQAEAKPGNDPAAGSPSPQTAPTQAAPLSRQAPAISPQSSIIAPTSVAEPMRFVRVWLPGGT